MELTPADEARVRAAIAEASGAVEAVRHRRTVEVAGVEKLAAAWAALEPEAKWWIQCALAERAGNVEPQNLDVGAAARAMMDESAGRQGERLASVSVKVAVRELFAAYVANGGEPEVGNRAHRSREGKRAHPACGFVAHHLLRLFPDTFGDDARTAERRADTYLREFQARGELPALKKSAK